MFKRLRTKIAEEAQRFPIQDLIDLNNSSGSPVLQPENEQFSINDEDDSNASELNSPSRAQDNASAGREAMHFSTPATITVHPEATDPMLRVAENSALQIGLEAYRIQSDTESEREDPWPTQLEGISKEQLIFALQKLRNRTQKYKTRYTEAIAAFKEVLSEREKLQHALSDTQDRSLRRLAELREQCQLEQQAKAHLEQNLQMLLEEKEQMISVLETKVRLLKDGSYSDKQESTQCEDSVCLVDLEDKNIKEENNKDDEVQALKEKIKRQEALLAKCKDTIKSNKERTTQLIDEKNILLEQLDKKKNEQENVQETEIQSDLQAELAQMREKLNELEKQQEENSMAMAETKRNMHEELELREQQLCKLKSDLQNTQHEKELCQKKVDEQDSKYIDFQHKHEEMISTLQNQLESTENNMEKERENLMQELSRGKAAALSLVKEECGRKINIIEEEWKAKIEELKQEHKKLLAEKEKEKENALNNQAEEFKISMEEKIREINSSVVEESFQEAAAISDVAPQEDEELKITVSEDIGLQNSQLPESTLVTEANQSMSLELDNYKHEILELQMVIEQLKMEKMEDETKAKDKLEALQCENNKLVNNVKAMDDLQKEKEDIDKKLKLLSENFIKNNEIMLALQEESKKLKEECSNTDQLRKENDELKIRIEQEERDKENIKCTLQHELVKMQSEKLNSEEELRRTKFRIELLNQQSSSKEPDDETTALLKEEIILLKEQLHVLETQTFGVSHVENYQNQLTTIKNNYEEKLKEKDIEINCKLKQMVRDFSCQMEEKETDYEKTLSSLIEKGQELEDKMERKHQKEMATLEKELYERNCALEDVTEHFQQLLSEKQDELQSYKEKIKETEICENSNEEINETDKGVLQTEANEWEDGWMDAEDTTSIPQKTVIKEIYNQENMHCTEHLEHIKNLESSIASSQEEIAELRFLLGLTNRSTSSSDANCVNEISLKLPEPTEFEYLRNILYEYMMGKEPMILARVIAAVLKFTEEQTHEILQRESVRQTLKNHWTNS